MIHKVFTTMKYKVINYTTLEVLETNRLATVYEWVAYWEEMHHKIEIIVCR